MNLLKNGLFNTLLASSPLREKQQKTIRKELNIKSSKKIFTSSNSQSIEIFETDLYKKKVIFFPGWLGHKDSKYLIPLAHLLHTNNFDIIRIHPVDHGNTEHLNKDFFRATDIQTLIEAVKFIGNKYQDSEIHLIGFSLGGNISLRISASDSIDFLKSTIVLSPVIDPEISMLTMDNTAWILKKYFIDKWRRTLIRKIRFHNIANAEEALKYKSLEEMTEFFTKNLDENKKIIGVGETGLDFYYDNSDRDKQIESFKIHIKAALKANIPLIIHSRNAEEKTYEVLNEYKDEKLKILMHCFTGSQKFAEKLLKFNSYFSASGIITFKNSVDLQNTFKSLPLDRILIETDSPFLAPVPNRGKKNEPSFIDFTAAKLAEIKGIEKSELIKITTNNFNNLFFN